MKVIVRFSILVAGLYALLVLAACDLGGDEEAGSLTDPREDLTGEGILGRADEAMLDVRSLRTETIVVDRQFASVGEFQPDAEAQAMYSVDIAVEDSSYGLHRLTDDSEVERICGDEVDNDCLETLLDLCRSESEGCASDWPFPFEETLWIENRRYVRRTNGEWTSGDSAGCDGDSCWTSSVATLEICGTEQTPEANASSGHYTIFLSFIDDPQFVGEEHVDGEPSLHVRGSFEMPSYEPVPGCPTPDETIPRELDELFPERFDGSVDLWVDPATFYLQRLEWHMDTYNGDRHLGRSDTLMLFSLFNVAEIPGPLPE